MVFNNINGKTKGYVLFPNFQIYENCSELCNTVGLNLFNFKVKQFNIRGDYAMQKCTGKLA